ncbi:MAG TPA: O-antigen ligase family protein [Gemmatimonadales bacterium]|nr:O-antigen ligase family protein [Gemmatimonadales bacterium]
MTATATRGFHAPARAAAAVTPQPLSGGRTLLLVLLALLYPWHIALWATSYTGKDPVIPHGGLNVSLGDSVIAIIAIVLVLQAAVGRVRLPRYALHAGLWLLAAAISTTANAISPAVYFAIRDSVTGLVKISAAIFWMIAVFWLLQDSFPRRFFQLAGLSVLAATGFAFQSVFENIFLGRERAFGPFQNANIYGNYVVLNLFLAIGIDRFLGAGAPGTNLRPATRAVLRPLVRYVSITLLLLGLLATGSRGAIVGLLAGLIPALPWRQVKRMSRRGLVAAVLGIAVFVPALDWYFSQNPFVVTRMTQTAEGRGPNVAERLELWQGAVQAFSENPVVGIGYTQFPNYAEHEPNLRATLTHQTYLAAAAELGIVGLCALMWLLLSVIVDSWRAQDRNGPYVGVAHACCGFVVAACTQGLFNNVQQERSLWIVFGIVAALIFYLRHPRVPSVTPLAHSSAGRGRLRLTTPV